MVQKMSIAMLHETKVMGFDQQKIGIQQETN